jgi:hypothetical protein
MNGTNGTNSKASAATTPAQDALEGLDVLVGIASDVYELLLEHGERLPAAGMMARWAEEQARRGKDGWADGGGGVF